MRILLPALAIALLVACGPPGEPPQPSPSAPAATSTPQQAAASSEAQQVAVAALTTPYNAASYEAGRRVFAQCRSCHTIAADGGNRVGPNLHGVFGREVGTAPGFNYSQPVQDANFTWDAAQLDHWLANPQTFLPGNRMAFAGVRDETQRRDLIAYLMVESASE